MDYQIENISHLLKCMTRTVCQMPLKVDGCLRERCERHSGPSKVDGRHDILPGQTDDEQNSETQPPNA